LEPYGFERIVPGEHDFADQVRRFASAEMILGPHGAGLTNLAFAPDATLVELFGSYRNACFFALARGMGHGYACASCRADGDDMVADVDAVVSLLDDVLDG
jgi:capsular polysaccharide biosynthesis protein